ncbi:MAG: thiamine pyrophosphate-binding protein [Candidatus Erginobacter occultus]|nr:thiamine pyrophosphate-binding protein [Candidatus Erginobacter occultus]
MIENQYLFQVLLGTGEEIIEDRGDQEGQKSSSDHAAAGAFAEQVPLIIISGAPSARNRESGTLVHHLVSNYYLQRDIYEKLTADSAILTTPNHAPAQIDRVIQNCIARKLPVYLELPTDIIHAPCRAPRTLPDVTQLSSDEGSLAECVSEAVEMIERSSHPLILAGVELHRFGLEDEALSLVENAEIPFATMFSSKSVLPEIHPQFVGIYQGGWSRETV